MTQPTEKNPSLADVSRRARVSIATASRVIAGSSHPVSPSTRERVLQAARETGYTPNALARALVSKRSQIIGVLVGDVMDPYFAEIVRGVEDVAGRVGYLTIVCNADRRRDVEREHLSILLKYSAAGAIFAGSSYNDDREDTLFAESVERSILQGTRVVSLAPRSIEAVSITVDNVAAGYDMTDYLLSLGHARLAFVAGPEGFYTATERLQGFLAALHDRGGLPSTIYPGDFSFESGLAAVTQLLAQEQLPDAILGCNDETAIGVVTALRQAGVSVPGDVSVAGIGGTRPARFLELSTVSLPTYELGAAGAQAILASQPRQSQERVTMQHRLLPRGTTARRPPTARMR